MSYRESIGIAKPNMSNLTSQNGKLIHHEINSYRLLFYTECLSCMQDRSVSHTLF